jgi:hypothetical protein
MNYKIIDNVFNIDFFKDFQKQIFSLNIPWYFRPAQVYSYKEKQEFNNYNLKYEDDDLGYFSLGFFNNLKEDYTHLNNYLYEIYKKLECKSLIQSRANLNLQISKKIKNLKFHTDTNYNNSYTAIFYMNNNNGGTFLLNKDTNEKIKIDNIENRLLVMNGDVFHAADVQTDTKRRIVININYF